MKLEQGIVEKIGGNKSYSDYNMSGLPPRRHVSEENRDQSNPKLERRFSVMEPRAEEAVQPSTAGHGRLYPS